MNTITTVESITELTTIQNPLDGQIVYVMGFGKYFTYKASLSSQTNGVTIIDKWEMEIQDVYYASWFATPNINIDQSSTLQVGWDYSSSKNRKFIFDDVYFVALNTKTYPDGLIRKIGLQVPNNSNTEFTENAALKVIPNAEPLGYVLNFYLAENFKIYNAVIYGDADEHIGSLDESNHPMNIVNCKNGFLFRPKVFNAWGDGIYLGTEYTGLTDKQCEDVTIFEPFIKHCGRSGISITSGKNIHIYNPKIRDIYRVYPKVGINIEGEGVGACKPNIDGVNIHGKIDVDGCDIAMSVYIFDVVKENININIGDIYARNCIVPVVTQLFASNFGTVIVGNIFADGWKSSVLRCNWSQLNCDLIVGDIYSINSMCAGVFERYSSIISIDIDAVNQPKTFIGNFKIGNIFIKDKDPTNILHPFYYKDNTGEPDSTRPIGKGKIGKIFGTTRHNAFYADGYVSSDFSFEIEFKSSYYLPPTRPFLYSKILIEASGSDFNLNLRNDYRTKLSIVKYDITSSPLRVTFPIGTAMYPLSLGSTRSVNTIDVGAKLNIEWRDAVTAFVTGQVGQWSAS